MLEDHESDVLDAIEKLPIDEMKQRIAKACEKLIREIFEEDARLAEIDIPDSWKARVERSIQDVRQGRRRQAYKRTKEDRIRTLRNHLVMLWGDAVDQQVDDEVQLIEATSLLLDYLSAAGYSEQEISHFQTHFMENGSVT